MMLRFKHVCKRIGLVGLVLSLSTGVSCADINKGDAVSTPPMELFLLVGQSNMAGRGQVRPEDRIPDPHVYVLNQADLWANQGEPIHFDKSFAGVGLGFTFAKEVVGQRGIEVVGLVPCAVGGTPIRRWKPGQDLFEEAVRRAKIAQKSGQFKAILWHQGESECGNRNAAEAYGENLAIVVTAFREALGDPDLPFIAGELGEFIHPQDAVRSANAQLINAGIRSLPSRLDHCAVVSSAGLTDRGDQLHFDASSQKEFGRRYHQAYLELTDNQ